jgi:hypothetical protein
MAISMTAIKNERICLTRTLMGWGMICLLVTFGICRPAHMAISLVSASKSSRQNEEDNLSFRLANNPARSDMTQQQVNTQQSSLHKLHWNQRRKG